jgi:hypothetical protein
MRPPPWALGMSILWLKFASRKTDSVPGAFSGRDFYECERWIYLRNHNMGFDMDVEKSCAGTEFELACACCGLIARTRESSARPSALPRRNPERGSASPPSLVDVTSPMFSRQLLGMVTLSGTTVIPSDAAAGPWRAVDPERLDSSINFAFP